LFTHTVNRNTHIVSDMWDAMDNFIAYRDQMVK
jgi:hypothetical protein